MKKRSILLSGLFVLTMCLAGYAAADYPPNVADAIPDREFRTLCLRIADTDGGEGRGWSRVKVSNVTVGPDSVLTYGVTNCSPSVVWDGTWLSASSFELKKAEGVR